MHLPSWSSITCSEFYSVPFVMRSTTVHESDESVPVKNPRFHDSTESYSLLSIINFPHDCCGIRTITALITPAPVDWQPSITRVFHPFIISPLPGVLRTCGLDVTTSIQAAVTVEFQHSIDTSSRLTCSPRSSRLLSPASPTSLARCP